MEVYLLAQFIFLLKSGLNSSFSLTTFNISITTFPTTKKLDFSIKFYLNIEKVRRFFQMAGVERIELPSKVLETPMLPLYHTPVDNLNYNIVLECIQEIFNL